MIQVVSKGKCGMSKLKPKVKHSAKLSEKLNQIYNLEDLSTTCCRQCSCCKVACPQLNYSEAAVIINRIWKEYSKEEKAEWLLTCIKYFFSTSLIKPCPMLKNGTDCTVYEDRPLSCFLPNTLVMTESGPMRIKDILPGTLVYGKDGSLHRVTHTRSKIYDGKIYNIRTQGNCFDNWCTEDHLWLVSKNKDKRSALKPEWVESKDLIPKKSKKDGHYMSFPSSFNNHNSQSHIDLREWLDGFLEDGEFLTPFTSGKIFEDRSEVKIPKRVEVNDEFLFMIGIYLAEGSSNYQSSTFTMHVEEKEYLDRIKKYLKEYWNVESHYNKIKNGKKSIVLRVDSCLFGRLMSNMCGRLAQNKKIDSRLFAQLNNTELLKLFESWHVGDGRKCFREKEYSGTTVSDLLASQMQMILMMNSIFPHVYKASSGRRLDSYDVHIFPSNFRESKKGQGTKRRYDESHVYNPMFDKEEMDYCGPVVDIQVEDSESFITMSGIAHNCRLYGLWPEDMYEKRVTAMGEAFDLPKEELPLNTQCKLVRRKPQVCKKCNGDGFVTEEGLDANRLECEDCKGKGKIVPPALTEMQIKRMSYALNVLDKNVFKLKDKQIANFWNYRTIHDWALFFFFGEEWLMDLTHFAVKADKEAKDGLVDQLRIDITKVLEEEEEDVEEEKNAEDSEVNSTD